jgi:predicted nucleic-acid-binding protein
MSPVKETVIPDTNVILRYLLSDHPHMYEETRTFFDKVFTGEIAALILESVITECIYVLTKYYRVPREESSELLIHLLNYKGIVNKDKDDLITALNQFATRSIDIVDCLVLAKANSHHMQIFTFDKTLKKQSAESK